MAIKFLRPCQQGTLYNEGEIASFDDAVEKRLVEQKFAEAYKEAKASKTDPAA